KVLFGLGIRYVGETVARKLAAHFKSIDALAQASLEELIQADEIGERIAQSILEYFSNPKHIEEINKLRSHGLKLHIEESTIELQSEKFSGKTFIISGVF